jgi:hypothetical protein
MRRYSLVRPLCGLLVASLLLVPQTGCVGFATYLMYAIKGNNVDAKCTALEDKRVAVVCVSGAGAGPRDESEALTRQVGLLLQENVKKIKLVRPEEVADWRDQNNWDQIDYRSIGRGVKADMVVAIDLSTFSIHDDQTLLRGRAKVKTAVYDMTNKGTCIFTDGPKEFVFPENGAQHVVENETNFKRIYLQTLAKNIAKNFYAYPKIDDIATESILAN